MKHVLLFGLMLASFLSYSQYPASGAKQRLGWQTTGDGLVYRGAIADTSTLDPSGLNNAWMLLDTVNGSLYAYRSKAWQLVSGGGGGGVSMPFDSVTFNINEGDASEQELKYSAEKGYLQYGGLDSVQIPLLPGIWYVRNDDSVTVSKGMVVRASGTLGASGRIKVKRMIADGSIPAMYVLGIAMHDIASGADGYVMTQGKIRQVNTTAYSEGAVLYADVDTLGGLTQTEPGNGFLKLPIAFVVHSASNGTLAVRIDAGSSLRDLHDVDTTGRVNRSVLQYNDTLKYWKASTTAGIVAGDTAAMLTNYINVADTATMLSSYISNADTSVFARDWQIAGTANYLPKFTGASSVGNSPLYNPSGNKIMLGHTSPNALTTSIEVHSASSTTAQAQSSVDIYMGNSLYADYTPYLQLYRNRSSTVGGLTRVNNGDWLGRITFQGADSLKYVRGAQIYALTDGATNTDLMPTALRFATNPGNQFQPLDRMSITSAGLVGIGTTSPARSLHIAATDAVRIPVGTDLGGVSANGDIRFNTTANNFEWYSTTSGAWRKPVISASATGLNSAGNFAYFKSTGLDSSNVLTQSNGRIGIGVTPTEALQVNGTARATRFILNTFGSQTLSINNYAPSGSLGNNVWIGNGGQNSAYTSGEEGSSNVSIGNFALQNNTTGARNLGIGIAALRDNNTGSDNLALGYICLINNENGIANTAIGRGALFSNTYGSYNTGIGYNSLIYSNGSANLALGSESMYSNTSGSFNTAIGFYALYGNKTGNGNIAIGDRSGRYTNTGGENEASSNSLYIGSYTKALASGDEQEIVIGHAAVGNGSNTTTIGNSSTTATYIPAGKMYIGGTTAPTATLHVNGSLSRNAPVTVTANYTVAETVSWIVCDGTATIALTLPAAASWTGREIMVKTIQPYTVTSASANVVPIDGVAATNAILPATDGAWATLVSDGTNWIIMQQK